MSKETVNRLYDEVINGQADFIELYNSLAGLRNRLTKSLDKHSATEIFDDSLLRLYRKKLPNVDFYNLLSKTIRDTKVNYFVKTERTRNRETVTDLIDETAATVVEIGSVLVTKEVNHRQVIDSLLRRSPFDADTTAIVNAALGAPDDFSLRDISRQTGIHVETVRRKLRKLSRYYDEAVFGSFHELFAS